MTPNNRSAEKISREMLSKPPAKNGARRLERMKRANLWFAGSGCALTLGAGILLLTGTTGFGWEVPTMLLCSTASPIINLINLRRISRGKKSL